jgi:hypothetical protein
MVVELADTDMTLSADKCASRIIGFKSHEKLFEGCQLASLWAGRNPSASALPAMSRT